MGTGCDNSHKKNKKTSTLRHKGRFDPCGYFFEKTMIKVFYMEFKASEITAWTTDFYTNVDGIFDEVMKNWVEILDSVCYRSREFAFDPKYGLNSPENERAVEVFDLLMSRFALRCFEPGSFSCGSVEFTIHCKPVIDNRSRDQPGQKHETPLALPC